MAIDIGATLNVTESQCNELLKPWPLQGNKKDKSISRYILSHRAVSERKLQPRPLPKPFIKELDYLMDKEFARKLQMPVVNQLGLQEPVRRREALTSQEDITRSSYYRFHIILQTDGRDRRII